MIEVRQTEQFAKWLGKLRDVRARAKIATRIRRIETDGNFGDVAPVGEGVSELRVHHGPGYRVYFVQEGDQVVILLCGGDKDSQERDIAAAKDMAKEL
jgi:putative addiction module killer protein